MGMHETQVRAVLKNRPGVRLGNVHAAIKPFAERWGIDIGSVPDADFGDLEIKSGSNCGPDNDVVLDEDGTLFLNLFCYMSVGLPDGTEELCNRLGLMVSDVGGAVEIIDLETSPSNDDAICLEFVGPTAEARRRARIHYGFERAWDFMSSVVPRERFDKALALCVKAA